MACNERARNLLLGQIMSIALQVPSQLTIRSPTEVGRPPIVALVLLHLVDCLLSINLPVAQKAFRVRIWHISQAVEKKDARARPTLLFISVYHEEVVLLELLSGKSRRGWREWHIVDGVISGQRLLLTSQIMLSLLAKAHAILLSAHYHILRPFIVVITRVWVSWMCSCILVLLISTSKEGLSRVILVQILPKWVHL